MRGSMHSSKEIELGQTSSGRAWVIYRLQSLPAGKLVNVINRILKGDDGLVNPLNRFKKETRTGNS